MPVAEAVTTSFLEKLRRQERERQREKELERQNSPRAPGLLLILEHRSTGRIERISPGRLTMRVISTTSSRLEGQLFYLEVRHLHMSGVSLENMQHLKVGDTLKIESRHRPMRLSWQRTRIEVVKP